MENMQLMVKNVNVTENDFKDQYKKTRVYFFIKDENVLSNLANRHSRPYNEYRKLLPTVLDQAGIKNQKGNWSQRAGCSCPCSPGFILQEDVGREIFVTI